MTTPRPRRKRSVPSPERGPVASTGFLVHTAGGRKRRITVQIGRPYAIGDEEAACPVAIVGLVGKLPDIRGADTVQALALALRLVRSLLSTLVENGGRVTLTDGTDVDLTAHFGA